MWSIHASVSRAHSSLATRFVVGRSRFKIALAFVVSVTVTPAFAGAIYGLSWNTSPGTVYSIDTSTGAATPVVTLNFGVCEICMGRGGGAGLEFLGGALYAIGIPHDVGFGHGAFGTINLATGDFTAGSPAQFFDGLAADPDKNVLYTIDSLHSRLIVFDPSHSTFSRELWPHPDSVTGLAYDRNHGILYGVSHTDLYTISTVDGTTTLVGALGFNHRYKGLAYDPETDRLYLNTARDGENPTNFRLYSLDVTTGEATLIGSNGTFPDDTETGGILDLAYIERAEVPEPRTIALVGAGLLGLWRLYRQRRSRR